MIVQMCFSKLHRLTVTGADLQHEDGVTIDGALLDAAGMREHEKVAVLDVQNGVRLETCLFRGAPGSGEVRVHGAAALKVHTGDLVIVLNYVQCTGEEAAVFCPVKVFVNEDNHIKHISK